jgi:hypothetical protein
MIRSLSRWMAEILPPAWVIVMAVGWWLFIESLYLWVQWWLGMPDAAEPLRQGRDGCVGILCGLYGVFRAVAFHPLFRSEYRAWLELTPWTSRKPLPLGPICLVPQDVVVLAIAVLALYGSPFQLVIAPAAFLGAYLGVLCLSLLLTDVWKVGYALAFGLGLAIRLAPYPAASVVALAALYPLAYWGLRRSLATFPWRVPGIVGSTLAPFEITSAGSKARRMLSTKWDLGWPYGHLEFNLPKRRIPREHAVLLSLLGGWLLYAAASAIPDPEGREVLPSLALLFGSMGCILGRPLTYCAIHWPPISLWGRIRTGRWIIPGYDEVFVASLCALLAAIAAPLAGLALGLPVEIVYPIALSLVLLITLNMGPTLRRWRLTGNHRIAPGVRAGEFHRL